LERRRGNLCLQVERRREWDFSYLGGAVGVGYSALFITASPAFWTLRTFFHSQYVGGISLLSVGGGGQVLLGGWRFKGVSNAVPNADPAATA
jgi:hypothetical protein